VLTRDRPDLLSFRSLRREPRYPVGARENSSYTAVAKRVSELDRALKYALAEVERVGVPDKLQPPVRTVVLVHAAQGIIDNGGLQYFFESDFPGQPPYSVFVDAYRAIGADEEASALAEAVKLFPFADPHRFQTRRDKFLERFQHGGAHRSDSPFEPYTDRLCGNQNVWRLLKKYVRHHAESFRR
jgi:hypothetical protein